MVLVFKRFSGLVFALFLSLFVELIPTAQCQIWTPKTKLGESSISDIRFQDKDTGYILSYSKVFRTVDAGETWTRILNSYSRFSKCYFADSKHGWIIGGNDLVLKTTNGGVSWSLSRTGNSAIDPYTIYAKDKDTVYMLAPEDLDTYKYGMFVYRSFDGGSNWSRTSTGSTQTMRGFYQWTKDRGIIGTLTMGVYRTQNGWSSYSTNTASAQIRGMSVLKDSIVVVVGNNGVISRSTNYGANFSTVTSPVSTHLTGLHFINDTLGMASGENGVILITKDGGVNWSQMVTQSTLNFQAVHMLSPLYAWAIVNVPHADSFQVFRFGNKDLISQKINFIEGAVLADVNKNCGNDNGEKGPSGVLIKATPGPYFTYTTHGGKFSLAIPDTGRFQIEALLPEKYLFGNGLCDTLKSGITFNSFEQWATGNDFMYDSDTSFKLEIKVSSSRKRRCAWNLNQITYRNIGTRTADSAVIRVFYPSHLITLQKHASETGRGDGYIELKTGKLDPNQQGSINILDSVLCRGGVMGLTVCIRVQITPQKIVQKSFWDSSWISTRIDCLNDSIAIVKLLNTGKQMGDSTGVVVYLDENTAGEIKYRLGENDSLRFEVLRRNQTLMVIGDINKHHPYYEQMRLWRERCGEETRNTSHSVVTRFELEKFPPFEDEFCLPIRDSYDPNDITVTPNGRGDDHWVKKDGRLNYHIRFQNTGNDTAYNIYIIDTLPDEVDLRSIEFKGSSHTYSASFSSANGKNILRFDFKNIYLVDSATNEPGSNGWVNFDVNMVKGLKHRRKISNFVDIYFDFNDPVRTNTAWIQIYDTVIVPVGKGVLVDCQSRFVSIPRDTLVCDQNQFNFTLLSEGKNKGQIRILDTIARLTQTQDTLFSLMAPGEGIFRMESSIWDCDAHHVDTIHVHFMNSPQSQLSDSIHCGQVNQVLRVSCYSCTYLWGNDSTQSFLNIDQPGDYTLKMENGCGVLNDTSSIKLIPYVQLDLGNDTLLCNRNVWELKNKKQNLSILWQDTLESSSFLANTDGWYYGAYFDRCNNLVDSVFLRFRSTPDFTLGEDTLLCDQASMKIELDNPDGEHIFKWENSDNSATRTFTHAGTFWVSAINLCGTYNDTLVIDYLHTPLNTLRDTSFCGNTGVLISPETNNNREILKWQDNAPEGARFIKQAGIYPARLENACGSTALQIEITQWAQPAASFSIENPCRTDSVITTNLSSITSNDALTYTWYLNGLTVSSEKHASLFYADSSAAEIMLMVRSDKACKDSLTLSFTKKERVRAEFEMEGICLGDSTFFVNRSTATDDHVEYFWTFGDGSTSKENNPVHLYQGLPGTYLVVLRAGFSGGCRDSVVYPVNIEDSPSAAFETQVNGPFLSLRIPAPVAEVLYRWKIGSQFFQDSIDWNYALSGNYFRDSVCLSAEDPRSGCSRTECTWLDFELSAQSSVSVGKLRIYPNPGTDKLNIEIPESGIFSIRILDANGRETYSLASEKNHVEVATGAWSSGVYLIEVIHARGTVYRSTYLKVQ